MFPSQIGLLKPVMENGSLQDESTNICRVQTCHTLQETQKRHTDANNIAYSQFTSPLVCMTGPSLTLHNLPTGQNLE